MSCPDTITMNDVTGCYTINKTLSDDPEKAMGIRGVAWPIRKAMKVAPPMSLTFRHNANASPANWTVSFPRMGPMTAHDEVQRLDYEWNERKNPVIGVIKARARPTDVQSLNEEFLKEGWSDGSVVYEEEINEKEGWEAHNVYGFMNVDGQRKFCRKILITGKKGEVNNSRMVYEYKSI